MDGEALEKGGRRKLEPGRSVVTIGRCEMTIRLLRRQPATGHARRGDFADAPSLLENTSSLHFVFQSASSVHLLVPGTLLCSTSFMYRGIHVATEMIFL